MDAETDQDFTKGKLNIAVRPCMKQEFSFEELISKNLFDQVDSFSAVLCILHQKLSSHGKIYKIADFVKSELEREEIDYIQIRKGNQYCYFLLYKRYSDEWYEQLREKLEQVFGGGCYLGFYEKVMRDSAGINEGISMAEQVIYSSFYDEEKKTRNITQKQIYNVHSPKGVHNLLKLLNNEVSGFHREEALDVLQKICGAIALEKYTHINVLRRIFMDIMGIYSMTAQSLNGSIEEIVLENDNCHYQKVMMVSSLTEMRKWLKDFENAFYQYFLVRYKCSQSDILKQALEYIELHLCEHIQLIEVAKNIGVSNTYLSTVFKREIGQSFVDYVNQKKIEMGKELLLQGKLVYEVSDMLGFENSTYFSKVFKKYQNISPDMIRKEKGKKFI